MTAETVKICLDEKLLGESVMTVKTVKRCLGEKLLGEVWCMGMTGIFYALLLEHGGGTCTKIRVSPTVLPFSLKILLYVHRSEVAY